MSNLWTHQARGDVAVTLSAAVAVVWVLLNLSAGYLMGDNADIRLPLGATMAHLALLTVIPVALGMTVRRLAAGFALRMERPVRILSMLFLALLVLAVLVRGRDALPRLMLTAGCTTFW